MQGNRAYEYRAMGNIIAIRATILDKYFISIPKFGEYSGEIFRLSKIDNFEGASVSFVAQSKSLKYSNKFTISSITMSQFIGSFLRTQLSPISPVRAYQMRCGSLRFALGLP